MAEQHPCRTRTEKALVWTVGHAGELAGLAAPVTIGAFTTPWLDLVSAAFAAVWTTHEIRLRRTTRQTRALAGSPAPRQLDTTSTTSTTSTDPAEARASESRGRREAKA